MKQRPVVPSNAGHNELRGSQTRAYSHASLRSRRSFLGLGAAGVGALGLAACGASSEETATTNRSATTGASPTTAASMPAGAPITSPVSAEDLEQSGLLWTGARVLQVTAPLDAERFGDWLPPGMQLAEPHRATLFVAHYPLTGFGSIYNEAAVLVHVEDDDGPALHCPWMVVDDDTALVLGIQTLGFPKKMAEVALREDGDQLVGTVVRKGTEVLRLEADRSSFVAEDGLVWARFLNAFGSVIGGMHILDVPEQPEVVHERSVGRGTATMGRTDRDPLGDWLADGEGDALWGVVDFGSMSAAGRLIEPLPLDWAFRKTIARAM